MAVAEIRETDAITSVDFPASDLLKVVTIIKDMASAEAAQLPPEDSAESISKFRYTLEFMVDFYDMRSPHFDVKAAILADFDKLVADYTSEWRKQEVSVASE